MGSRFIQKYYLFSLKLAKISFEKYMTYLQMS